MSFKITVFLFTIFSFIEYPSTAFYLAESFITTVDRVDQMRLKRIRHQIRERLSNSCNNLDKPLDEHDAPVLVCAIEIQLYDLLEELLINGADPNICQPVCSYYPLHQTSKRDTPNIRAAKLLLDYGAQLDVRGAQWSLYNMPPISSAAKSKHVDLVRLFLERGADPDLEEVGSRNDTPLMYAMENFQQNPQAAKTIVGWLLFYGANPYKRNNEGDTAIIVAGKKDLLALSFLLRGAQKNLRFNLKRLLSRGETPFSDLLATLITYYFYNYK